MGFRVGQTPSPTLPLKEGKGVKLLCHALPKQFLSAASARRSRFGFVGCKFTLYVVVVATIYERQGEPLNPLTRLSRSRNLAASEHIVTNSSRAGLVVALAVASLIVPQRAFSAPLPATLPAAPSLPAATSSTRLAENADSLALPPVDSGFARIATTEPDLQLVALDDILVSNATPQQIKNARVQLAKTARLMAARDANTLQVFGLQQPASFSVVVAPAAKKGKPNRALPVASANVALPKITLSRLAISENGALMRITIEAAAASNPVVAVSARNTDAAPQPFVNQTLFTGARTYDLWYSPQPDGSLTLQAWPIARDAADVMSEEAERVWQNSADADDSALNVKQVRATSTKVADARTGDQALSSSTSPTNDSSAIAGNALPLTNSNEGDILDVVAEYRGGQWLPLRASAPWRGALLDSQALAKAAAQMKALQVQAAQAQAAQTQASNAATSDSGDSSNIAPLSSTRTVIAAQTAPAQRNANPAATRLQKVPRSGNAISGNAINDSIASRSVRPWLVAQMNRYRRRAAGTAHFIFQRGKSGWIGVDSVFEASRDASQLSLSVDENAARSLRTQMQSDGYLSATSHRDFALLLARVHLQDEAADELAKARLMQPDLISDKQSELFESNRVLDPRRQAQTQRDALKRVGFAPEHPAVRVPYLLSQFRQQASPLTALRLGLEYSRLGYEREAAASLTYGEANATQFLAFPATSDIDRAWFGVLRDQLTGRLALASSKPPNIVRSDLFTVRCSLNDPNAPQLLAGLENAQLKIYSSFGVPMGNTEVILWSSQSQFQAYTTRQAGRNTSEFVTALTITQLVNADVGPVVLGEEINFFADRRADSISTIAHEYGHIAVRALAKGRPVPDWLNEGIATYTEGGYDNYIKRVRIAKADGKLLSMQELQAWNVDGERAFLAYSQANSMTDFIVARWGKDAILDILAQIGKDIVPNVALRQTLHVTPDGFYQLWLQNGIK